MLSLLTLEPNVSQPLTPQITKARLQFKAGLVVLGQLVKYRYIAFTFLVFKIASLYITSFVLRL